MRIFLIRHAETASNAARILQTPEIPLSERGIRQAQLLARRLAGEGIAYIWSSDLTRAVMTARHLQEATGAELQLDSELQERNYGDVRGRPYAELGVDILAPDYEPPGGETWERFHLRVDGIWARITRDLSRRPAPLAIVTHGLVCYSLALRHLCLTPPVASPLRWHNASVTVIDAAPPWMVRVLNCTAHLEDGE
jgi:broad specificity phosphatase PhoE